MKMFQSYYSRPHSLPSEYHDSFYPGNATSFHTSITSCFKTHEHTQSPHESVFDRYSTIPTKEHARTMETSIDGNFNYVDQPNIARNIQSLSSFTETPPSEQKQEEAAGSCFSSSFVEAGGLSTFWNGRYSNSIIARRNERERNRVKTINQTFAKLRHHLPSGTGRRRKLSKVQILRLAIQYIHQLQKTLDSEMDKMEAQKETDRQTEQMGNGSLMDGRESTDETSSFIVSSPSPTNQSESHENGHFDLALLMNGNMDTAATPKKQMEGSHGKEIHLDIWKHLSMDAFSAHRGDSLEARPSDNSSEFLL